MTIPLNGSTIAVVVLIVTNLATLFSKLRSPQIKSDKENAVLKENLEEVRREMSTMKTTFASELLEIKTTHIEGINKEIKDLTATLGKLSNDITRLSTILDERIPKKV